MPKRPINLTLDVRLVKQARDTTDNLSGLVEQLLAGFISSEQHEKMARSQAAEKTAMLWNKFNANSGSIADEYSTL
jgi:antitoxin CcdA